MWDMGDIPMPGGWMLSMAWMPMCGQSWAGAAASFVGMWAVMMVAMMLPSLLSMVWRLRPAWAALAGLTAILLAIGVMEIWAMAIVAAAVTAERLAPDGQRVAWAVGAVSIGAGVYLMGRAAWLLS